MSELKAFAPDRISDVHVRTIPWRSPNYVSVEIADAAQLADVRPAWLDLLTRADAPNVFMDPELLRVTAEIDPATKCRTLLAWKTMGGRRQLVGVWAFGIGRARKSHLPIPVLTFSPYAHGYLATPVIDRHCLEQTLHAMLDRIADDPHLPKIMALDSMATEGATMDALMRVLTARNSAPRMFETFRRPKLASQLDGQTYLASALSSSTRKKLRQHRRRLGEQGTLTSTIAAEAPAVRAALEDFLAMEASGWKGREGTALLSNESEAKFMRAALAALGEQGCASIHALRLDGRPISMQIIVRSGRAAFTWKTAYDEAFREFSPGMLLFEHYTTSLLADDSIEYVDSCSLDDSGYMGSWTERQAVADLWIDARRGGSIAFRAFSGIQKNYRHMRAAAKDAYLRMRAPRPMKPGDAAR
jgi:CelD/BcsL family acetyltransferase involved in cellulose biosynthesis